MSTIRQTPYIESVLASMTAANLKDLRVVLNSGGNNVNLDFAHLSAATYKNKITPVYFQFEDSNIKTAILIWTNSYCTLVCYHRFQDLLLFELDPNAHTYKKISEYCDINELRRVLDDTIEISSGGIDSGDAEKGQVPVADGNGGVEWKDIPETLILTGESGTLTDDELALAKQSDVRLQLGDNGQFYYKNSQNNYYIIFKATARVAGDDTIVEKVTIDLSDNTYAYSYDVVAAGESFTPTYDDELSDASTNAVQNKVVTEALDEKANVDGNYPTMTVGAADNLTPYDEESGDDQDEPFSFQATGTGNGSQADFATGTLALMKEKRGNSVVVNQYVNDVAATKTVSGITFTNNGDGTITLNGTATDNIVEEIISTEVTLKRNGNSILVSLCSKMPIGCSFGIGGYATSNTNTYIMSPSSSSAWSNYIKINIANGTTLNNLKLRPLVIDLTQWFGSNDNIPDDLLAHPENFFRYYQGDLSYNTGQIVNANSRYIKCIGRNQWDEEWEVGGIDSDGQPNSATSVFRSKNYIRVIPNSTYCIYYGAYSVNSLVYYYLYDKDYNFISYANTTTASHVFTVPSNACYMKIRNGGLDISPTYANNITVSIYYEGESGYDQYYPYEVLTNNDTGTEELLSAGNVADSKTPDGVITRKVNSVDLSTFNWQGSSGAYYVGVSSLMGTVNLNLLHSVYYAKSSGTSGDNSMEVVNGNLVIHSTATPTGTLYYAKATPTTEQGTPFSENLVIDDFGSMEFSGTSGVPQGNLIFYPVDYKAFVDTLYDYTEGTPSDIALKSDISGMLTQQDLSDEITDVAGLDYNFKKAYKIGNQIFITMRCKNSTGNTISSASTLFRIGSLKPSLALYLIANIDNLTLVPVNISSNGDVSIFSDLTNNAYITFALCYAVA